MEVSKKKFDFKEYNDRMRKELVKFDYLRTKQNEINCSSERKNKCSSTPVNSAK